MITFDIEFKGKLIDWFRDRVLKTEGVTKIVSKVKHNKKWLPVKFEVKDAWSVEYWGWEGYIGDIMVANGEIPKSESEFKDPFYKKQLEDELNQFSRHFVNYVLYMNGTDDNVDECRDGFIIESGLGLKFHYKKEMTGYVSMINLDVTGFPLRTIWAKEEHYHENYPYINANLVGYHGQYSLMKEIAISMMEAGDLPPFEIDPKWFTVAK